MLINVMSVVEELTEILHFAAQYDKIMPKKKKRSKLLEQYKSSNYKLTIINENTLRRGVGIRYQIEWSFCFALCGDYSF